MNLIRFVIVIFLLKKYLGYPSNFKSLFFFYLCCSSILHCLWVEQLHHTDLTTRVTTAHKGKTHFEVVYLFFTREPKKLKSFFFEQMKKMKGFAYLISNWKTNYQTVHGPLTLSKISLFNALTNNEQYIYWYYFFFLITSVINIQLFSVQLVWSQIHIQHYWIN